MAGKVVATIVLVVAPVLAALGALAGAAAGDSERVTAMWIGGQLRADGQARVTEVIDYDFGSQARHGIFRDVPGLVTDEPVTVAMDGSSVPVTQTSAGQSTDLRIGDPDRTITGRHRYEITYTVSDLTVGSKFGWDAVGNAWQVPIENIEVNLVSPQALDNPRCVQGRAASQDSCQVAAPVAGQLQVRLGNVSAGEGMTIYATLGARLTATPARPPAPSGPANDPGASLLAIMGAAFASTLALAVVGAVVVRRLGRERVFTGGATEAAYATSGTEVRMTTAELAELATIEFAPPRELTPAQGGALLAEQVRDDHKVAWLLHEAVEGYVDITGDPPDLTLVRLEHPAGPATPILDAAFVGRTSVPLGKHDADVAKAWVAIDRGLKGWLKGSELWDPRGDRHRALAIGFGIAVAVLGTLAVMGGAAIAVRQGPAWLVLTAAGGAVLGFGWAAATRSGELRVRTPIGSGLWLRVESFRRFLAASEAEHVRAAAEHGNLREYSAWAVAVGEVDHWTAAVKAAGLPAAAVGGTVLLAPYLGGAMHGSVTTPTSSGGGGMSGGFGGGVGGGGGGGGGGSW